MAKRTILKRIRDILDKYKEIMSDFLTIQEAHKETQRNTLILCILGGIGAIALGLVTFGASALPTYAVVTGYAVAATAAGFSIYQGF